MVKKKKTKQSAIKTNKNIFLRVVLLLVLLHFSNTCLQLFIEYRENCRYEAELTQQIKDLQTDVDAKKHLLESSSEKEIIERAARERFGYAYPNETIYIAAN